MEGVCDGVFVAVMEDVGVFVGVAAGAILRTRPPCVSATYAAPEALSKYTPYGVLNIAEEAGPSQYPHKPEPA